MEDDTNSSDNRKPEERVTHIRMANGALYPCEFLTEEWQQPEYVRKLAKSAREASRNAIKRLLEQGIPAVYGKGKDIVRLYPDGHEEIIEKDVLP